MSAVYVATALRDGEQDLTGVYASMSLAMLHEDENAEIYDDGPWEPWRPDGDSMVSEHIDGHSTRTISPMPITTEAPDGP